MSENAYIKALQKLINREVGNPAYEPDGYIDRDTGMTRLTVREAQTAIDYGIPIGVHSLYCIHHGSRKGEYPYQLVSSVVSLRRHLTERSMADFATIAPHMRHPAKLLGYLHEIHEVEDQMMALEKFPPPEVVERLRAAFPPGCRVELVRILDSQTNLLPGDRGTVVAVDSIGTIHVTWDNASSLGVSYRHDRVKRI